MLLIASGHNSENTAACWCLVVYCHVLWVATYLEYLEKSVNSKTIGELRKSRKAVGLGKSVDYLFAHLKWDNCVQFGE